MNNRILYEKVNGLFVHGWNRALPSGRTSGTLANPERL